MMRIMMGPEEQVVLHLLWLRWCDGDSVSGVVTRPPCQVCLPASLRYNNYLRKYGGDGG